MNQHGLPIEFDPALMETVVTRAISKSVSVAAGFTEAAFHREADPLYRVADPVQRTVQFRALFARWFRFGQFDAPFADAVGELRELQARLARVLVTGAASRAEERADLAAASGTLLATGPGQFMLGISVQPARLLDCQLLRRWLRHELWHVRDMLDPAFQYGREDLSPADGPADRLPQRVVQERYALLWSISIDARIERAGLLPLCSKEERLARLAQGFPGYSTDTHRRVLDAIGNTCGRTHAELLELARRPQQLAREEPSAAQPLRGSPCPLCRFPTFQWADSQPHQEVVFQAIRRDYPAWSPDQGICSTCFDLFSIRSGLWT